MNKLLLLSLLVYSLSAEDTEFYCSNPKEYVTQDKAQKSTYKNCKRNGMTWWYTGRGTLKSKVYFLDNKENGLYSSYYDNGMKKLVVMYLNGQKHGLQKTFYSSGELGSSVKYEMGRREGVMTDWDINGYKYSEVFYKHNYKVGLKKYYDLKGNVTKTETYKMDRNPVVVEMLKNKRKEVLVDLSKYGLMPKDTPKEQRLR